MKKLLTLLLSLIILATFAGCAGESSNNGKNEENPHSQSATLTRDDIIEKFGGVLSVDVPTLKTYLEAFYGDYYISGKILEVEFDEDENEYTYKIRDDHYYSTIEIHGCSQEFKEQDYIYATVGNDGKFDAVSREDGLSLEKGSHNYITVKEYQDICDKINSTQFKITGYIYAEKQGTYAHTYYDYYIYESEEAYGKEDAQRFEVEFITEPENISGKKIQIIGKHEAGGYGLTDCSIVTEY